MFLSNIKYIYNKKSKSFNCCKIIKRNFRSTVKCVVWNSLTQFICWWPNPLRSTRNVFYGIFATSEELITSMKATTRTPETTYRSETGNVYPSHPQAPPNFDPSRPPPDVHPPAALPNNPYLEMLLRSFQGDLMQLKWTMGYRDMMGYNKQTPGMEPRSQHKSQRHRQHRRHDYQPPAPRRSSMNCQQTVAPPRTPAGVNELPIDLSTTTSAHIYNSDKKKDHLTGTDAENAHQMRQEAGQVLQAKALDLSMPKPPENITISDLNNTQSFLGIGPIHHRPT